VVLPTCTEPGYDEETCEICGAFFQQKAVEALGHVEGEWVTVVERTYKAEGEREKRCTVCGELLATEAIPADAEGYRALVLQCVVIGVLLLAALASLAFWFVRRKHKREK
jgi:hypothetical protein